MEASSPPDLPYPPTPAGFCEAIAEGDVSCIALYMGEGMTVEGTATHRPVHAACRAAKGDILKELVRLGADLRSKDAMGGTAYTALKESSPKRGDEVEVCLLLLLQEHVVGDDADVMMFCLRRDFVNGAAWMMEERGLNVNSKDANGRTWLHKAARLGATRVSALFVDNGADLRVCDKSLKNAMDHAILNDNEATRRYIMTAIRDAGGIKTPPTGVCCGVFFGGVD